MKRNCVLGLVRHANLTWNLPAAYVIANHKAALFKVGHTTNLRQRIANLETKQKASLLLEGAIFVETKSAAAAVEAFIQDWMKGKRSGSGREWFACSQGDLREALYAALRAFSADVKHVAGIAAPRAPNDRVVYQGVDTRTASGPAYRI